MRCRFKIERHERFWRAFRYVSREMSAGEEIEFESELARDPAACEDVAAAVELVESIRRLEPPRCWWTPSSTARPSGWLVPVRMVAALVLTALTAWMTWSCWDRGGRRGERDRWTVVPAESGELGWADDSDVALAWSQVRSPDPSVAGLELEPSFVAEEASEFHERDDTGEAPPLSSWLLELAALSEDRESAQTREN